MLQARSFVPPILTKHLIMKSRKGKVIKHGHIEETDEAIREPPSLLLGSWNEIKVQREGRVQAHLSNLGQGAIVSSPPLAILVWASQSLPVG